MGDPKKQRRKYSTPEHPWRMARIEEEKQISKDYAMKNKTEIWKVKSMLEKFKSQAKNILANKHLAQSQKEKAQLMQKLSRIGLLAENTALESALSLTLNNLLERRLQSLAYRKGLANSMKQARQFIVHGHIIVGDKNITSPSYIVLKSEENTIGFSPSSTIASEDHPERVVKKKEEKIGKKEDKKEGKKPRLRKKETKKSRPKAHKEEKKEAKTEAKTE